MFNSTVPKLIYWKLLVVRVLQYCATVLVQNTLPLLFYCFIRVLLNCRFEHFSSHFSIFFFDYKHKTANKKLYTSIFFVMVLQQRKRKNVWRVIINHHHLLHEWIINYYSTRKKASSKSIYPIEFNILL